MTRSFIHQVIPQLKAAARTHMVLARPWVRRQPAVSAVPPDGPWKDPQLPLNYYWVGLGLFCAGGCLTVYLLPAPPADSTNVPLLTVTAKVALEAYKGLSNEIGSGPGVKSVKPGTAKAPQTQTKNTKAETVQPNQEPLRKAAGLLLKQKRKGGRKRRRLRFRK
ncbi:hypothetical protein L226DRAFT_289238 [Lentinus tigrinus ALCF2SS1-7]|uniref:uncharacterized protein n=1 Tax=Lentinus tigrinus ALCF2SS1-7 TaxID=1328758 RepID=UPI001165FF01|nr:hypothetical protein L226DRAFT_289238 [Lentinus tigrinus ALCF2SS1-7]